MTVHLHVINWVLEHKMKSIKYNNPACDLHFYAIGDLMTPSALEFEV